MSRGKSNSSSPQRMRLITWRPVERGGLRGFASVELPIGLRILDIPVFAGRYGPFADKFSLAVCELIRTSDPDALVGDRAA